MNSIPYYQLQSEQKWRAVQKTNQNQKCTIITSKRSHRVIIGRPFYSLKYSFLFNSVALSDIHFVTLRFRFQNLMRKKFIRINLKLSLDAHKLLAQTQLTQTLYLTTDRDTDSSVGRLKSITRTKLCHWRSTATQYVESSSFCLVFFGKIWVRYSVKKSI